MDKALLGEPAFARLCTQQIMEVRVLPGSLCTCGCHKQTPYFHPVNTKASSPLWFSEPGDMFYAGHSRAFAWCAGLRWCRACKPAGFCSSNRISGMTGPPSGCACQKENLISLNLCKKIHLRAKIFRKKTSYPEAIFFSNLHLRAQIFRKH